MIPDYDRVSSIQWPPDLGVNEFFVFLTQQLPDCFSLEDSISLDSSSNASVSIPQKDTNYYVISNNLDCHPQLDWDLNFMDSHFHGNDNYVIFYSSNSLFSI